MFDFWGFTMSSQYEDAMEQWKDRKIAEALGISDEELASVPYEIQDDASDDGLVYSLMVVFGEGADQAVLDKIEDLEDGNIVRLSPSIFDEPDEP